MDQNMPKDTIERAIKRGSGGLEGVHYEEIRYEGYGINGAAVIVDCMTDNRTRTVADVRHAFSKYGGNLGTDGSVAFLFKHCGQIVFAPGTDEDKLMEAAIDAGADDVVTNDDGSVEVITGPHDFIARQGRAREGGLQARVRRSDDEAARPRSRCAAKTRSGCRSCSTRSNRSTTCRTSTPPRCSPKRSARMRRILGIDPGLRVTGFGVLEARGNDARLHQQRLHPRHRHAACPMRLGVIVRDLAHVIAEHGPTEVAVEKVFVNINPHSTLLLGQARGAAISAAVLAGLPVTEYTALQVKQAVVGAGRALKEQVQEMVRRLLALPGAPGVRRRRRARGAICHAHASTGIGALARNGYRVRGGRLLSLIASTRASGDRRDCAHDARLACDNRDVSMLTP